MSSATATDHDTHDPAPKLRNTTTALLVLALVFVALRFAARFKRGLTYGADDWMIVVSLVRLSCISTILHLPGLWFQMVG